MGKIIRNIIAIVLLLLSLIALSGCIEVIYEITIDKDDSEIITLTISGPSFVSPYLKDIIKEIRNNGFAVKTEYTGERVVVTGTKKLMKGSWDIPSIPGYVTITKVNAFDFYVTDYVLLKRYVLDLNYTYVRKQTNSSTGNEKDFFANIPLTFVVNYRGKIIKTNATDWNNKTATWALNMKRFGNIDIQLVTYKINYILVTALILLFLGLLTLVLYFLARLFKSPSSSAPLESPKQKRLTGPEP